MKALTKEEWLRDIPELIYKLKKDYGFYFSGYYSIINKDILEVIKPDKHKHKIICYRRGQRFFLVVYKKNDFDIYYTNEYVKDTSWNRINYFLKKFNSAYKKAEEDYAKEETNYRPCNMEFND